MNGAVPCLCAPSNVLCYAEKCDPPPLTHTFLKWRFLADFKKYTHPPPPPQVTTCLHMEAKLVEIPEKCQNPQSWHIMNVPERYIPVITPVSAPLTVRTVIVDMKRRITIAVPASTALEPSADQKGRVWFRSRQMGHQKGYALPAGSYSIMCTSDAPPFDIQFPTVSLPSAVRRSVQACALVVHPPYRRPTDCFWSARHSLSAKNCCGAHIDSSKPTPMHPHVHRNPTILSLRCVASEAVNLWCMALGFPIDKKRNESFQRIPRGARVPVARPTYHATNELKRSQQGH